MVLRILNVAEKPSAAKEIVAVFRRGVQANVTTRQSRSRFNIIYEFDMQIQTQPAHMIFTSVLGHLKGTEFEQRVRKWNSCDPSILLNPAQSQVEWTIPEDKQNLAQTLRNEARTCDWLILWLDCDSEGEKIASDVADVCSQSKPNIIIKRARFSAMTNTDIFRAINSLDVLNENISNMVSTRQEIDLRAGSAYTRFLTKQLQKFVLTNNDNSVISYGPCQFPTLGIIVDRWLVIKNFVSRDFWVFELFLKDCDILFEWLRKQIFDEYSAMIFYELAYEEAEAEGYVATVEHVDRRQRNRWRPLPLSTVEMQKIASRVLHISSDRTMEIAEALYNKGLISYPRTETDKFATSYNLRGLIEKQTGHNEWGSYANRLLTPASENDNVTFTWPRAGGNDDGAHPPIHPTESSPETFEHAQHKILYNYITKRFLASCSIDAKGSETIVKVRVGSSEYFTAQGLIVEEKGYLEVIHPFERWNDKQMPITLLQQYSRIPITSFLFRQSRTQPPPLLSEADLISLMDHHHIGTDATIAEHIKKVLDREYVEKVDGGRFNPTDIGLALVIAHERCRIHLARPHMRAKQEDQLKQIVNRTLQPQQVLNNVLTEYQQLFQRLIQNRILIDSVFQQRFNRMSAQSWNTITEQFSKCGICNQMMSLKSDPRSVERIAAGGPGGNNNTAGRGNGRSRHDRSHQNNNNMDRGVHCNTCDITLKMPRNGTLAPSRKYCPICQYEISEVSNTNSQSGGPSTHTVCPKCYNEPPTDTAINPEQKTSEFRCFLCVHPTCEFARGTSSNDSDVAKCPKCSRSCLIRTSNDSATKFITCSGQRDECQFVYFFPRNSVENVSALANETCTQCESKKLSVTWIRRNVPPGTAPYSGCIWCDISWRNILNSIGESGSAPIPPHPGMPRSATESNGRGRGRQQNSYSGRQHMDIEDAAGRGSRGRGNSYNSGGQHRARGRRGNRGVGSGQSYQNSGSNGWGNR